VRALDRKLIRDVRRIWAQALAIALVMASGVATLVLGDGAYRSIHETRAAYYDRGGFGDVFAQARRRPKAWPVRSTAFRASRSPRRGSCGAPCLTCPA